MKAIVLALLTLSCTRTAPEQVAPSPENKPAPSVSSAPPPPDPGPVLSFSDVRCTYGGTAPAFFVWIEASAKSRVSDLRAITFEIAQKGSGYASGASGAIDVRVRERPHGEGNAKSLTSPLEAGATVHLEVFGALALASFGPAATYPTDDRAFRVVLVAREGRWTVTGKCVVGPAG